VLEDHSGEVVGLNKNDVFNIYFFIIQVLEDHSGEVVGLGWHPHGSLLATGSADMTVNLYPLRFFYFYFGHHRDLYPLRCLNLDFLFLFMYRHDSETLSTPFVFWFCFV